MSAPGMLTLASNSVVLGTPVIATLNDPSVSGTVTWTANGLPMVGTGSSATGTPTVVGEIKIKAAYKDVSGASKTATATANVRTSNTVGQIQMSSTSIVLGSPVTATLTDANGLTGPIKWMVNGMPLPDTTPVIAYTPKARGEYRLNAMYRDVAGNSESVSATFTVTVVNIPGAVTLAASSAITATLADGNEVYGPVLWTANDVVIPGNGRTVTYVATQPGTVVIKAVYRDRAGNAESPSATYVVA
jgi:hypothetical protein